MEAVQKAEELQPDLILLDIGLPKLNGIEVGKRVRKASPNTKILFLSQETSPDVVEEALRSGGTGYVVKTRAGTDLLPGIGAVLASKRFVSSSIDYVIIQLGSHRRRRHEILFCLDDVAVVDGLGRFIAAALNTGDAAIVWATHSHREGIRQRLHAEGVDVDAAIQSGLYISSDVSEPPDLVRIAQAMTSLTDAASKAGKEHPRIAVCGERAGRLWAEGKTDEAIRLEQLLNDLAKVYAIDILCTYPDLDRDENYDGFKSICDEHSAVYSR